MEQTLEEQRLAFLQDTVQYYSEDLTRRAASSNSGRCSYLTDDGRKCAIGRHIVENTYSPGFEISPLSEIFKVLPNNVKALGYDFLSQVQSLHDKAINWNLTCNQGLTESGKHVVQRIINFHCISLETKQN